MGVLEVKTKMPARVTVEAHWSASRKVNLDLALPVSSAGGLVVQLKEFLVCTPMSENTTTGSKPPWEETLRILKRRLKQPKQLLHSRRVSSTCWLASTETSIKTTQICYFISRQFLHN